MPTVNASDRLALATCVWGLGFRSTNPCHISLGEPVSTQPTGPAASAPAPDEQDAAQFTKPFRQLAAVVLVSVDALLLVAALAGIFLALVASDEGFATLAGADFSKSVNVATIAFPIVAVLIATHLRPAVAMSKTIVLLAVVEYIAAAVLGVLSMIAGFVAAMSDDRMIDDTWGWMSTALSSSGQGTITGRAVIVLLERFGWLAVLGTALYVMIKLYRGQFGTAPAVAAYGYPQSGYGQQYAQYQQQAAYGQQQAAYAQQQQAAQQAAYGQQQQAAAQAAYGQQQAAAQAAYGQQQQAGQPVAQQQGYGYPAGGYSGGATQYPGYPAQPGTPEPAATPDPATSPYASYVGPTSAPSVSAPPASPVSAPGSGAYSQGSTEDEDDDRAQRTQVIPPGSPAEPQQHWSPPQQ